MDRINQAVETCLSHATHTETPFLQVSKFIEELRRHPDWTQDEVMEVQMRVIRALIHELRPS